MARHASNAARVRVTTSLDATLVKALDKVAKTMGHASRSRLVEEALQRWVAEQKRRQVEEEIEQYYLPLSEAEREEDRQWAVGASHAASRHWK